MGAQRYLDCLSRLWSRKAQGQERHRPPGLFIECLEDRTLPSILFSAPHQTKTDNGGPVMTNVQVQLIFWGSYWNNNTLVQAVHGAVNNILTSTYMDGLAQYRGIGRGSLVLVTVHGLLCTDVRQADIYDL